MGRWLLYGCSIEDEVIYIDIYRLCPTYGMVWHGDLDLTDGYRTRRLSIWESPNLRNGR